MTFYVILFCCDIYYKMTSECLVPLYQTLVSMDSEMENLSIQAFTQYSEMKLLVVTYLNRVNDLLGYQEFMDARDLLRMIDDYEERTSGSFLALIVNYLSEDLSKERMDIKEQLCNIRDLWGIESDHDELIQLTEATSTFDQIMYDAWLHTDVKWFNIQIQS